MTERSHSLLGVLRWAKAPGEVITWAEGEPLARSLVNEIDDGLPRLLDGAPSNRAVLWLLAVLGVEAEVLVTAVGMMLETRLPPLNEPRLAHALEVSLATLLDAGRGDECLVQVKLCELLAETPRAKGEGSYRTMGGGYAATCRAMSIFARVAESIGAHGARMEADRMARARKNAGVIGVGLGAMVVHQRTVPASLARPLSVELPPPHELVFATEHLTLVIAELETLERPSTLREELLEHLSE